MIKLRALRGIIITTIAAEAGVYCSIEINCVAVGLGEAARRDDQCVANAPYLRGSENNAYHMAIKENRRRRNCVFCVK